MINRFALILTILTPAIAQAQVSIVNALPEIHGDKGWTNKISASVSWEDNNSKKSFINVSGGGSFSYKETFWLVHFVTKGSYKKEDGENKAGGTMEHFRFRASIGEILNPLVAMAAAAKSKRISREQWYDGLHLEGFTQYEHDKFRALNSRALLGTGLAYSILSTEKLGILVGSAYMVEYIDFTKRIDSELNHRWSNYVQLNIAISETISGEGVTFAQFKFDDFGDHLLMANVGLKINITENFGIRLGAGIEYDSNPPPNIKGIGTNINSELFVEF